MHKLTEIPEIDFDLDFESTSVDVLLVGQDTDQTIYITGWYSYTRKRWEYYGMLCLLNFVPAGWIDLKTMEGLM